MAKWKFAAGATDKKGRSGTARGVVTGTRAQAEAAAKRRVAADGYWAGPVQLQEQKED